MRLDPFTQRTLNVLLGKREKVEWPRYSTRPAQHLKDRPKQ